MEAIVKAYGKVLIFGAYAILEPGNVGLVVNIDKGTTTTAIEETPGKIVLDLSNFKVKIEGNIEEEGLFKNKKKFVFIKNAVEYTFRYLVHKKHKIKDVKIITRNDPELYINNKLKTGFGSSASSTVSAVAAILSLYNINDKGLVYKIARYSHYVSQGSGSGFDVSASTFGSHFFYSNELKGDFLDYMEKKEDIKIERFDWPSYLIPIIFYTGKPASTQKLVQKILMYKEKNYDKYNEFMNEYNKINLKLKDAFVFGGDVIELLEKSWEMRKKLGEMAGVELEPRYISELVKNLKKIGALTAGLLGAGGGDSMIVLCKSQKAKEDILNYLENKFYVFELNLTNRGYEVIK